MLHLIRTTFAAYGIFGRLLQKDGTLVAVTLEHAFPREGAAGYTAKIPQGTHLCVQGPHRLKGMDADFRTFEITGVPGHSGLIFHWGNYDRDSEGCILLGTRIEGNMVLNSKIAFGKFMKLVGHKDSFFLSVEEQHDGPLSETSNH